MANLIRRSRTLLVLDGLEPLQHPPSGMGRANRAGEQEGRLKDQAMRALLRELAAQQHGLCVVSTRLRVGDLEDFEQTAVISKELDYLSPQAGARILRAQGVVAGDVVAGLLPRVPELPVTALAAWRLGAVYQPLFTAFGPKAIAHRLVRDFERHRT